MTGFLRTFYWQRWRQQTYSSSKHTPLSPLWPPLFLEHVLLFKFHQLLLSMTGKGHFLSFIASLATDRTTSAKGGGEGTKASIRAILTQRGIQQQNIMSVNACPELREKGDPGSFPSLTEYGSGLSSPFGCEVEPREAENATRRKFVEWGFLLPPGEAARHNSRHLRTQNLKTQVQISTLLEDQCHMSVPSHPSCPNTADTEKRLKASALNLTQIWLLLHRSQSSENAKHSLHAKQEMQRQVEGAVPYWEHTPWSQTMQVER